MCCKKSSCVELHFEKNVYVFIPRSFPVISVCNRGKNLCTSCIIIFKGSWAEKFFLQLNKTEGRYLSETKNKRTFKLYLQLCMIAFPYNLHLQYIFSKMFNRSLNFVLYQSLTSLTLLCRTNLLARTRLA